MKLRLLTLLCCMSFTLMASAQARGGEIRRQNQRTSQRSTQNNYAKPTKPSSTRTIVKISEPNGHVNGHGYVDLGLPSGIKWAHCNIGATHPEEFGDLFAWGMKVPGGYSYENYPNKDLYDLKKNYTLPTPYDTAFNLWEEPWRMPTIIEFEELVKKCQWTWMECNNVNGYIITGPNGNSIFLPAAGSSTENKKNVWGLYWSSSVLKAGKYEELDNFYYHKCLMFKNNKISLAYGYGAQCAMSIRAVHK